MGKPLDLLALFSPSERAWFSGDKLVKGIGEGLIRLLATVYPFPPDRLFPIPVHGPVIDMSPGPAFRIAYRLPSPSEVLYENILHCIRVKTLAEEVC